MRNQLAPLALCLTLILSSVTDAQGRRGRQASSPGAQWAHDGEHVVLDGAWRSTSTWAKVKAVPRR